MIKYISVLLAAVLIAGLSGCDRNAPESELYGYERYGLAVSMPEEYRDEFAFTLQAELGDNIIAECYHMETREKYPELGWVCSIVRLKENEYGALKEEVEVFSRDAEYLYAALTPDDVTYYMPELERKNEAMAVRVEIGPLLLIFAEDNGLELTEKFAAQVKAQESAYRAWSESRAK